MRAAWNDDCYPRAMPRAHAPLLVVVSIAACSAPSFDILPTHEARGPTWPVATGESATVTVTGSSTFEVDHFDCHGCTAVPAGAGAFRVTRPDPGKGTFDVTVRRLDDDRSLDLSADVTFEAPTSIAVYRMLASAPFGATLASIVGEAQVWCFGVTGASKVPLGHDPAAVAASASGGAAVADADPATSWGLVALGGFQLPNGAPGKCARITATARGAADVDIRYGAVERHVALDVIDETDVTSIDVLDASSVFYRQNDTGVRDVADDAVSTADALGEVRADACSGAIPTLLVRASTNDGHFALARVSSAQVVVAPAALATFGDARDDASSIPTLAGTPTRAGDGTLQLTVGAVTRTLPLHVACRR